ncbi:DUF1217 domain-containing protein [Fodinicurvata sediminis]|uniref:DUF1217 domain-containing protein n=1 Tax=Fodinicurvata sediminis TaxID=1121832 RepID=UPI0003B332E9|nr:DUF1217 domain-containing protein [Fodinicurvata sediminis]
MNNWQAVGALFGVQTGGFSGVGGSMALGGGDPITQYRTAQSMKDRQMEMVRQDPMVKRDIAEFNKALENAETPEDLLNNRRSMEFLLRGLGMADQIGNDALIRKGFLEDPSKQDALVNRLQDKRYKEGAEMFRFAELGLEAVRNEEFKTKFTESYVQQRYEEKLAETNPAIPDAMAFERIVKDSKKDLTNPYNILGDPLLRRVVTTALGLPREIAVQSVEAQARAVTSRMDLSDLKDPQYVDKFVQRFLMNDTRGGQQGMGGMAGLGGGGGNGAWQTNLLNGLSGGGGGGLGGGGGFLV